MKIKEFLNKRVDVTKLVKKEEDGSEDLTNVMLLGQAIGVVSTFIGLGISVVIHRIINKKES